MTTLWLVARYRLVTRTLAWNELNETPGETQPTDFPVNASVSGPGHSVAPMTLQTALHLHRAERTDQLADGLAELLRRPLADPFAQELVVVPARGVERWLTQRLSHRLGTGGGAGAGTDGVCAGVQFTSPWSLVSLLLAREQEDPWDPDRLTWPLLATLDEVMDE